MQKSEARLKMSDVFDRRVAPVLEKLRQGQQVSESEVSSAVELLIKDTFEVNTASQRNTIDVVVEDPEGNCIAAIEVKSPRNTAEMITSTDFNKKALHQIFYYYLLGRYGNDKTFKTLQYYIITDLEHWYFFDNTSFARAIPSSDASRIASELGVNEHMKTLFPRLTKDKSYKYLEDYLRNSNTLSVLQQYYTHVRGTNKEELFSKLYDLFCFEKTEEATELNKDFYNELLYIMGLKESTKQDDIPLRLVYNGVPNTFAHQLDGSLKEGDPLKDEDILRISIWLNRILFLKLLEANLVKFNGNDPQYKFLDTAHIRDFPSLDKLFFQVLAVKEEDRIKQGFDSVPYLNSSLFEEHEVEKGCHISSIANEDIPYYPKTILKNKANPSSSRTGTVPLLDYLFEFLDSYNFSSGKEAKGEDVISPAVLGLIFEKINGYKDGSYYTPDNITSFMARKSLETILLSRVNKELGYNFENYDYLRSSFKESMPEEKKEKVKQIIKELKIFDPAVGSGHFLVSAMNVLLKMWYDFFIDGFYKLHTDEAFDRYFIDDNGMFVNEKGQPYPYQRERSGDSFTVSEKQQFVQKTLFEAKKYIIEHNLHGVDINPNAVQIAKLRLWIELLKNAYYTEESGFTRMQTLPNLEFKIICADTLIPLFREEKQRTFIEPLLDLLKELMQEYYHTNDKKRKEEIRFSEYPKLMSSLEKSLSWLPEEERKKIMSWSPFSDKPADWFEPEFMFGIDKFDVVITNPPYIQLQRNGGELGKKYQPYHYEVFTGTGDIYLLFFERGIKLLNDDGVLCYITSNKWLRSNYGKKLRSFVIKNAPLQWVIDLGPDVFDSATVDTAIALLQKTAQPQTGNPKGVNLKEVKKEDIDLDAFLKDAKIVACTSSDPWTIVSDNVEANIKQKVEQVGVPLNKWNSITIYRGVVTGLNEAFIINTEKRNEILDNCKSEEERSRTEEIIEPYLRGRDVYRYGYQWADLWLIGTFPVLHLDIDVYPALKEYFLSNFDIRQLEQSGKKYPELGINARKKTQNKWFEIQDSVAYYNEFNKEKVIWSELVTEPRFCYDTNAFYIDASVFFMVGEHVKYLAGFFNSKAGEFVFKRFYAGGGLGKSGYQYKKIYVVQVPVPSVSINPTAAQRIEELVDKITEQKKQDLNADTSLLEKEIDQLVYKLYGFSSEEIAYIETYCETQNA